MFPLSHLTHLLYAFSMRVLSIKPRSDQASKPKELIQISGHQNLSLSARRAITLLWHTAHQQGIEAGKDYTIDLSTLSSPGHNGHARTTAAIITLMQTLITIHHPDGSVRRVQFLGGNDMDSPDRPNGTLTYSFDKRLVEVLEDSAIWGKISLPILMSLSSKYAVSLYENLAQWAGLSQRISQTISLEEFRSIIGVEDKKYKAFGALNKHVIKLIVDEINALAPFNVSIMPIKTGKKVTDVRLGWWNKSPEEIKNAWSELQNVKIGRKARISGQVSFVFDPSPSVKRLDKVSRIKP